MSLHPLIPTVVATAAPLLNCIQFIPQLHKTYTRKSVKDLSLASLIFIVTTSVLWLAHGYFIMDASLIFGGIVTVTINVALLFMYFAYRKRRTD
jgi:uncharacterized protein with PQ loop repeat